MRIKATQSGTTVKVTLLPGESGERVTELSTCMSDVDVCAQISRFVQHTQKLSNFHFELQNYFNDFISHVLKTRN